MTRFPIYINYDPTQPPIGFIELDEDRVPEELMPDIAIVPALQKRVGESNFRIVEFGLIARQAVDTSKPRPE